MRFRFSIFSGQWLCSYWGEQCVADITIKKSTGFAFSIAEAGDVLSQGSSSVNRRLFSCIPYLHEKVGVKPGLAKAHGDCVNKVARSLLPLLFVFFARSL